MTDNTHPTPSKTRRTELPQELHRRPVSLQWKLVRIALVALTLIIGSLLWHQYQHLSNDLQQSINSLHKYSQERLGWRSTLLAQDATQGIQQLNRALGNLTALTPDAIADAHRSLQAFVDLSTLQDTLQAIAIRTPQGALFQNGDTAIFEHIKPLPSKAPIKRQTHCNSSQCFLILQTPLVNHLGYEVLFSVQLEPLRKTKLDSGAPLLLWLQTQQPSGALTPWQAELHLAESESASAKQKQSEIAQLVQQQDYRRLISNPTSINGNDYWGVIDLADSLGGDLTLLAMYPDQGQHLQTKLIQTSLIYALAGLVLAMLLAIALRQPARRLEKQAKLIPMLGEKQYQRIREQVATNKSKTQDELDLLDESISTLTYQLEYLESAVDARTQEMERLSLFDSLTGLANRHMLQYELKSELQNYKQRKQESMTVLFIFDLDQFKRINDSLGHHIGDQLLERMGKRLKQTVRSAGFVSRLGGDEFALLLRNIKHPQQLELVAERILKLVSKPIELNNQKIVVFGSIGVSMAHLSDTANDLIKHAEIAMYKAKEAGGNCFQLFDPNMAAEAQNYLSLESDIRRGFEEREFTLFLQPKCSMNGHIQGFEALVRWDHEERGLLPPGEFIPAMESMGLIAELDNWMLESTCRQLKVLENLYPRLVISVNISSTHFADHAFLGFLKSCLKKYPIDPRRLELEITETLLMETLSSTLDVMGKIKEMGVRIAIDDFGTGYSSLSYLKNLPVDSLKIDREFIKDIPYSESDMQISSVIIFLAKQLNYEVVAEGVETSEQLVFLKASQCDLAQGFYFSKPIPAHKALLMLESERINTEAG